MVNAVVDYCNHSSFKALFNYVFYIRQKLFAIQVRMYIN